MARGTKLELAPPQVDVQAPTQCPKCGGARRAPYWGRQEQKYGGTTSEGRVYRRIVRRRTRCLDCGQVRIDRNYE